MPLNVEHLYRTAATLEQALLAIDRHPEVSDRVLFAGKHGMLSSAEVERWLAYRANRNSTAHDYGAGFANDTLALLPTYLEDVRSLAVALQKVFDANT